MKHQQNQPTTDARVVRAAAAVLYTAQVSGRTVNLAYTYTAVSSCPASVGDMHGASLLCVGAWHACACVAAGHVLQQVRWLLSLSGGAILVVMALLS